MPQRLLACWTKQSPRLRNKLGFLDDSTLTWWNNCPVACRDSTKVAVETNLSFWPKQMLWLPPLFLQFWKPHVLHLLPWKFKRKTSSFWLACSSYYNGGYCVHQLLLLVDSLLLMKLMDLLVFWKHPGSSCYLSYKVRVEHWPCNLCWGNSEVNVL